MSFTKLFPIWHSLCLLSCLQMSSLSLKFYLLPFQKFASTNSVAVKEESINKLEKHMKSIISSLPEDLQSVLSS